MNLKFNAKKVSLRGFTSVKTETPLNRLQEKNSTFKHSSRKEPPSFSMRRLQGGSLVTTILKSSVRTIREKKVDP